MEDHFYDTLLQRRQQMMFQYEESLSQQRDLDRQQFEVMSSLLDEQTSITDMVDGFVSYKINRYRAKLDHAVKRMKGEMVCDSDIIMADLLEPQYLVNSIQDKIIA